MKLGSSGTQDGIRQVIARFYVTEPEKIKLILKGIHFYDIEVNGKAIDQTYVFYKRGRFAFMAREGKPRTDNPVPKGQRTATEQAKRRYKAFRDQEVTGTYELRDAPDYAAGAKSIGHCTAIQYTTWRGNDNNKERYNHDFLPPCMPLVMRSADGHYWSKDGRYRFTYRGFVDQPHARATKAGIPPFPTGLVIGYLDALLVKTGTGKVKKLSFVGKRVLLCATESGYNFFTVWEP